MCPEVREHTSEKKSRDHQEGNENFLTGIKPVLEMLKEKPERVDMVYLRKGRAQKETDAILDLCSTYGVRFQIVNEDTLHRLCPELQKMGMQNQGVLAKIQMASRMGLKELLVQAKEAPLPLLLALDQVQDPGNIGTLARTLYALGGAGLVLPRHNSAFLGIGAMRSSAGALADLPVAQVVNLARAVEETKNAGFAIYAAEKGENTNAIYSTNLQLPALVVLGSEESGIRPGVREMCDTTVHIPFLRDFDSLNVAQAGALVTGAFLQKTLYPKD